VNGELATRSYLDSEALRKASIEHATEQAKLEEMFGVLKADFKKLSTDVGDNKTKWKADHFVLAEKHKNLKKEVSALHADIQWLIEEGFFHVIGNLRKSHEYVDPLSAMQKSM
jgi:phage host-nuclease inhibitor protein Gam